MMEPRRYTTGAGVSLAADVGGDPGSPAMILTHGAGQTRYAWGEAAAALVESGFHVISLDLRGHGESDWPSDGDYRVDTFVADLQSVISTLSSPPALVGASLGGVVSLLVAGEDGTSAASALVLVDVTPRVETRGATQIRDFMRGTARGFTSIEEAAEAVAAYLPHRPRPKDISGLMKNLRPRDDGKLYWHWDPRVMESGRSAQPGAFQARLENAARNLKVPTLLVRGSLSELVSTETVAEFRALYPSAEYVDVHGSAHMVAGDKNTAFNAAVIGFLQRTIGRNTASSTHRAALHDRRGS
jgi:non-heme chloroperoxidase